MEKSLTNNKMDVGYLADGDSHSEFVVWQDTGCPEWGAEDDHGEGHGDWSEDAGQLAALGKGKGGKGKGKFGKGKGKGKGTDGGKGVGKGKGKDKGWGAAAAPPTGAGKGADDRMCYNCWEWGHIGKDCPQPDRRKAARSLEASPPEAPVQPSQLKPLTLATATSRV